MSDNNKTKSITCYYYHPRNSQTNSPYKLDKILDYINSLDTQTRSINYISGDIGRLLIFEKINIASIPLITCRFGKLKNNLHPDIGNIENDELKGLKLSSTNERFTESTFLIYDPEINCLLIQQNKLSLTAKQIAHYLSNYISDEERRQSIAIELDLLVNQDTLRKIKNLSKISSLSLTINNIYNPEFQKLTRQEPTLKSVLDNANSFAHENINRNNGKIKTQLKISDKSLGLSSSAVINTVTKILKIPAQEAELSNLCVSGDKICEEIKLFNDTLKENNNFVFPANTSINHQEIEAFFLQKYMERREYIKTII